MKNRPASSLLFILITVVLLSACAQPALEPTPVPTQEPTLKPQPTATEARLESDYYSYTDGIWTKYYQDELTFPFMLPEDMEEGSSQQYQMIQSGYFAAFDAETQVLTMRSLVVLARIYRDLQFQLVENMQVSCLPFSLNDTPIQDLKFMYSKNGVGFPPGPGNQPLADILPFLTTDTYIVLVLTDPVDPNAVNPVAQIAAICPK